MLGRFAFIPNCARNVAHCIRCILPASRMYWIVAVDLDHVPYMPICANCLAATTGGRREVWLGHAKHAIIPYCSSCLLRVGRYSIGLLARLLASILLGLAACLFLPMLPWISEGAAIAGAVAFSGIPWLVSQIWRNHLERYPSLQGKAVFAVAEGLACLNAEWATHLGNRMGVDVHSKRMRINSRIEWTSIGVVIALIATPWLYDTFHPFVRILNLTEDVLLVFVDNHKLARVQSTSSENPLAGLLARVPTGSRHLLARHVDGTLVDQVTTNIFAGRAHLFAPGRPPSTCFWVERTGLGRSQGGNTTREVLEPQSSFWSIKNEIDVWFGPASGSNSRHFTGGVVTALRQGTCTSGTSGQVE